IFALLILAFPTAVLPILAIQQNVGFLRVWSFLVPVYLLIAAVGFDYGVLFGLEKLNNRAKYAIYTGIIIVGIMFLAIYVVQENSVATCDENPSHNPDTRIIIPYVIDQGYAPPDQIITWTYAQPELSYYTKYFYTASSAIE